jgi:translation initiation factor 1
MAHFSQSFLASHLAKHGGDNHDGDDDGDDSSEEENLVMINDLAEGLEDVVPLRKIVHIRNQQRNGRKTLTTIQGLQSLPDVPPGYEIDVAKVLKYMRTWFSTNGTLVKDKEDLMVIQLQGDFRKQAFQRLVDHKICQREYIKVH